jgi:isopentenyl diphosphate isomerase/L-lactate dehydrogenase-like FMN-dependent dehydrogenase
MTRRPLFAAASQTPLGEYVNTFEMETAAAQRLSPALMAEVASGDRRAFEKITFRPRMMVDTRKMDLSVELWGERHFTPILAGPVFEPSRFGAGDILKGAAAAKAGAFRAISPTLSTNGKAVCLTLTARTDWSEIEKVRKSESLPVILKGVLSAADAVAAVERGVAGIVVSNYRPGVEGLVAPLDVLPSIAKAVGKQVPVLLDGGIRRGADVIKALALGAKAVLVARPVIWGLATHGEAGVRTVLEMLQTGMARDMAMLGKRTPAEVGPESIKVHSR